MVERAGTSLTAFLSSRYPQTGVLWNVLWSVLWNVLWSVLWIAHSPR